MNDWFVYIEEWFNASHLVSVDEISGFDFDITSHELVDEFDAIEEELDRIFSEDLNEFRFSESYLETMSMTPKRFEDLKPYHMKRKKRARKIRGSVKKKNSTHNNKILKYEKKEGDTLEEVITTDKNVRIVSQLPTNNKKENIKVVVHDDQSVTVSCLNHEGKRCTRNSIVPYNIDIETARSTYRNGILEIVFNRK